MKQLILLFAALALTQCDAVPKHRVYFGAVGPMGAYTLGGYHDGQVFLKLPADSVVYPTDTELQGLSDRGQAVPVIVYGPNRSLGICEPDLVTQLVFTKDTEPPDAVLFWHGDADVAYIQPDTATVQESDHFRLRDRAVQFAASLYQRLPPAARPSRLETGAPAVRRFVREEILVAEYPLRATWAIPERSTSGSVLLIYSQSSEECVLQTAVLPGLVEGFLRSDTLVYVHPYLFFRVGSDTRTYFLAERSYLWEHCGMAIFDLAAGKEVVGSN